MRNGEMRTRDIAEHIGLGVSRIRELLGMMNEVEAVGGNKNSFLYNSKCRQQISQT